MKATRRLLVLGVTIYALSASSLLAAADSPSSATQSFYFVSRERQVQRLPIPDVVTEASPSDLPGGTLERLPSSRSPDLELEKTSAPDWAGNEPVNEPLADELCFPCGILCPHLYGTVDYLFLNRSPGSSALPLLVDANTGDALLTGQALKFGFQSGMRATIGYRPCDLGAIEFGYFGYFNGGARTSASAAQFPGAALSLPGDLGPASNVFFGLGLLDVGYTSNVNSYEINWACCCCDCRTNECQSCSNNAWCRSIEWYTGLRYLSLDEHLNLAGQRNEFGGVETGNYDVRAKNDLYGAQAGLRWRANRGRWGGEAGAKAGLFANNASQQQYILDYPDYYLRAPVGQSGMGAAFVGELTCTAIYQLNQHWGLRCGYNLMWLQGVALAPSQLDYTFTPDSGTELSRNDGLFLHGFNFGVEARW